MNFRIYDYEEAVREDIEQHIKDNKIDLLADDFNQEDLFHALISDDAVTGNGSGSYTMDTMRAQLYLVGNTRLTVGLPEELGISVDDALDPETLDVLIRCSLVNSMLEGVLEDLMEVAKLD